MSVRSSSGQSRGVRGIKWAVGGLEVVGDGAERTWRAASDERRVMSQRPNQRAGITRSAIAREDVGKRANGAMSARQVSSRRAKRVANFTDHTETKVQ